jgi:scyllo-inositol 2-dehydrogenase (NADP+)
MPLSVGIIGFGRIGAEHERWLHEAGGVRAVAVADVTPARRMIAQKRGLRTFDDVQPLLRDPTIDAVLISTPTAMHFEQVSLALAAGKHVMVEKPMALDCREANELIERAEKQGQLLSVFHNRRWDPDYLTVRDAVASGVLGKLLNVESRIGQFASCVGPATPEYRPGWRTEAAFGGGGLYDLGSHFIDQMWRLLWPARPLRVFAQLRGNVWSTDCDDFARVVLDFDGGTTGLVEINTTTLSPLPRWHLDGSAGSASGPQSPQFDSSVWAQLRFTPAAGARTARPLPRAQWGLSPTRIWELFAAAASGRGAPAVTTRSVLPTMQLLDAARQSSREGVAVQIDASAWQLD